MPQNIDRLNTVSPNSATKLLRTNAEFHLEVICKLVSELRLLQNDESNKPATISPIFDAKFDDTLSTFRASNYLSASARSFDEKVEKHSILQHRQPFDGDVIRNEGEPFLPGVNFSSVNKFNKLF